ncbi:MAG: Electron transfer flavoprotein subunit beta [Syntrophaceae bacterium PtaU1.Bin231]|nr:MAG: Electron transfer flavoprotein subunit beta [Syntrophaceae bacterium PtaU1.Bin231]
MNIVVAMKQVPDLKQIRIRNREPVLEDVPLTFGDIDKNALEAATALKEKIAGKIIVVSVGGDGLEDTVKEALAAGADEAVLACDASFARIESDRSAVMLSGLIRKIEDVGLVLLGEGSADNYSGQVGSRLAEILGLPQAGSAASVDLDDGKALVTRRLEETEEVLELELPAVVSVLADINEPVIPGVTMILKAGRKPKTVYGPGELSGDATVPSTVRTLSNLAPEQDRKRVVVKDVSELIAALKAEGRIGR